MKWLYDKYGQMRLRQTHVRELVTQQIYSRNLFFGLLHVYIKVKRELCARLKDVMLRSSRRRFTSLGAGSLVRVG